MKRYKAIFDLPDNIIPPPLVGFQTLEPTGNPQQPYAPTTYKSVLFPIQFYDIEEVNFEEKEEIK